MSKGHRVCLDCAQGKLHINTVGMAVNRRDSCAVCGANCRLTIHVVAVQKDLLYVAPPPPPPPPAWRLAWEKERENLVQRSRNALVASLDAGETTEGACVSSLASLSMAAFEAGWEAALRSERDPHGDGRGWDRDIA